jgi:hypothetical protein
MTGILAAQSAEMRTKGAALLQQADRLLCESWNERMWPTAARSIPPRRSTGRSTVVMRGLRLCAPVARRPAALTFARCRASPRRASTISPAGFAVRSAAERESDRSRSVRPYPPNARTAGTNQVRARIYFIVLPQSQMMAATASPAIHALPHSGSAS